MRMLSTFAGALNATHKFLHLMGAKVAPDKSYNFGSCLKARNWLKETIWEHIDSDIHVISDFRYLGAHLTTMQATSSSTMDKRWEKAKQQLKKLRFCPATAEAKGHAMGSSTGAASAVAAVSACKSWGWISRRALETTVSSNNVRHRKHDVWRTKDSTHEACHNHSRRGESGGTHGHRDLWRSSRPSEAKPCGARE